MPDWINETLALIQDDINTYSPAHGASYTITNDLSMAPILQMGSICISLSRTAWQIVAEWAYEDEDIAQRLFQISNQRLDSVHRKYAPPQDKSKSTALW